MKKTLILALILTGFFLFLGPNLSKVSAITLEELQAQIQQLLQIIQQLLSQSRLSQGPYCFTTDLSYGMTSPEVQNLQIVLGVQPATGYFGDSTLAAVKKFQEEHNIKVTGEVGPQTRSVLNSLYCVPSQCSWCGQDCIRKTPTMQCPQVTPPLGVECKEVNGVCTKVPLVPPPTKYSCVTTLGTISANTYSTCVPNTNGNFNSLEECQKVCSEISFKCGSLSGKYSMTFTEAVQLFNNSECKSLGDPYKLPIYCQRCDPKTNHSKLYNAIYGEDTALLDKAAYRIGECIINVKDKTAYINKGPDFCTGATGAEGAWTIVCAMQNTSQEGWYSLEGIDGQVSEVKLLRLQECSNCQLSCFDTADGAIFFDNCSKRDVTSYGGEFRCKSIGVPPKNPTYIQELIKNYYSPTGTCTDSDGGKNIYIKGTVNYNGVAYTDECAYCSPAPCSSGVTSCSSLTCGAAVVKEYYCENGVMKNQTLTCPSDYTCQDGACVSTSLMKASISGPKSCSISQAVTYSAVVTNGVPPYSYEWSKDNLVSASGGTATYKWDKSGVYSIRVVVKDSKDSAAGASFDVTVLSPTGTCTDSDGNNTSTKGTVTYQGKTYTDFCTSSTTVNEYVCGNEQVMSTNGRCSYKCEDGKCVLPSQSSCDAACKAKGYTSGTCRSWPVTPTAQWGCSQNETALGQDTADCYVEYGMLGVGKACCCSSSVPPVTCTDSDGGKNIYTKGHAKGFYDAFQSQFETDDYCGCINNDCSKTGLWEYYCKDATILTREAIECPSGYTCQDGACKQSVTACTDTDGGNNLYVKGSCYDSTTGKTYYDYCDEEMGGTKKGGLEEVNCQYVPIGGGSPGIEGKTVCVYSGYTCPNGCKNGACLPSSLSCTNCTSLESLLPQLSDLIKKLRAALVQLGQ